MNAVVMTFSLWLILIAWALGFGAAGYLTGHVVRWYRQTRDDPLPSGPCRHRRPPYERTQHFRGSASTRLTGVSRVTDQHQYQR
ncbi:MAG: hypothetical protein WCA46_26165 [Actinocatenispora sp.]